jgi:hypothetical protein
MDDLTQLAKLIKKRNLLECEITTLIGRPAILGHIGEYIASKIFHINLEESATHKGSDGRFSGGVLDGRTVNIKWYARREGLLDINPNALPDYYLVLTGPKSFAMSSRGQTRPWIIESVFLFDTRSIIAELERTSVKIGIASSIQQEQWRKAEIFPQHNNNALQLSEEQHKILALFGPIVEG